MIAEETLLSASWVFNCLTKIFTDWRVIWDCHEAAQQNGYSPFARVSDFIQVSLKLPCCCCGLSSAPRQGVDQ